MNRNLFPFTSLLGLTLLTPACGPDLEVPAEPRTAAVQQPASGPQQTPTRGRRARRGSLTAAARVTERIGSSRS